MSARRLEGRVAIVTGAARGQGAAHARRLHAEGARVLLGDVLDAEGEGVAAELGDGARYVHLDVSSEPDWGAALAAVQEAFGPPTILINNAAIFRNRPLLELDRAEYEAILAVNLIGTWLGMKTVAPVMAEAGGGAIVNIGSNSGLGGFATIAAYSSSKWGVRGLTKAAALELGPLGIRVNAVHPGITDTPMLSYSPHDPALYTQHPIKRPGQPDEIAGLVAYLVSDEAAYATGADFVMDGGMTVGQTPPSGRR